MSVKIGFVGLRNIGRGHARRLAGMDGVLVTGLCDTLPERLQATVDEVGDAPCFSDYDEMLEKADMDAVVISVPNHLHVPFGIKAMESGKDIYVEKPLAHCSEEAEKLIEARDRTGRRALLGMSQRLNARTLALRDYVAQEELGKLYYGKAYWVRQEVNRSILEARKDWQLTRESSGGGPVVDTGVHVLDRLLFLADFPKALGVSARAFYGLGKKIAAGYGLDYAVEDFSTGIIHFEDGFSILLESSFFHSHPEAQQAGIELYGHDGCCLNHEVYRKRNGSGYVQIEMPPANGHASCAEEHFCRMLMGRESCIATLEQGLYVLKIIEAMYQSADRDGAYVAIEG